ncbi:MAG: site-2 protease family protein [Anaerolineales bacterium]
MFRVARLFGINVYIHPTFWLLVVWVVLSDFLVHRSLDSALQGILFVLALFVCVVFHEFGHVLTARHYGVRTRDITLYPIGGVARLERIPEKPWQELWIALAGPAVNGLIALLLLLFVQAPLATSLALASFSGRLLRINLFLAAFNLLPAFPMDGGRVLRALLALKMEYFRATSIAARVGKAIAFLFGVIGIFGSPSLLFIALFVWLGASEEGEFARQRASLSGVPVAEAMLTHYEVLSPQNTLQEAIQLLLASSQPDFPVVENGHVLGMLTREALADGFSKLGEDAPVTEAMLPISVEVHPQQLLDDVLILFRENALRTLPVTRDGLLVGLLTSENIADLLLIRAARHTSA